MNKKNYLIILLVFNALLAWSQNGGTLSGKITDLKFNPISNARVHILNSSFSVFSDENGKFSFSNYPAGNFTIQISALGYATITKDIPFASDKNKPVAITLNNSSKQLDEVIVSAQKKEEVLQKVPFSITALSSLQVQEYRLWDSKEITAIVPNLYSADPGDNRNVISIRGITTTSYDPAIATYIDGVNQFGLDNYISELLDLERIEILKGPQGTLYGRNAMGGVINIITKQPTNIVSGFTEISIGNYNQQRYSGGLRIPLIKSKLFFGIAAVYDKRDGFYKNEFNNLTFDKQHNITGNYYLKYVANTKWTITLNTKHHNLRNDGAFPMTVPQDINEAFNNPFVLNQNAITKMVDDILNSSVSLNYYGHEFNFALQTAYQSDHRYYTKPIDGDFSPADIVSIINNYDGWNKTQVLTQEFKFNSSPASTDSLKWTTGAFLFYNDNPVKQATRFGADAALFGAPENSSVITTTKGKSYGTAFYGQISYAVNTKMEITGGVRFDYEKKKYSVLGEFQMDPDPSLIVTLPDTNAIVDFSAVSQKIGLSYALAENNNLFFICSRGYRTGGLTQLSSDPSQPPLYPYKPEFSTNLEVGCKSNFFNNKFHINIAGFITFVSDAQVPTFVLPEAITVTRNAGKLKSRGFEAELNLTPFKGLECNYSFGYTNAEYTKLNLSQNGSAVNLTGNKQIFTPELTSMLAAQYSYEISSNQRFKLIIRGEWEYIGKQYFDLTNNITQKPYNILNTRCGFGYRNFELMFWGRNLQNTKYIAYAFDFGAIHLGNPKSYGFTVATRF